MLSVCKQTKITYYFKKIEKEKETKQKRKREDWDFKTPNDLLYQNNYWCR